MPCLNVLLWRKWSNLLVGIATMLNKRMKTILTTGLLCSLLRLMPTVARAAEISDEGHFFSAEAIATANQSIRDLEKKGGHEVRIETFASLPAGKADAVAKMDARVAKAHSGVAAGQQHLPAGFVIPSVGAGPAEIL